MTKIYSGCGCEVIEHFPNFCPECRIAELEALKVLEKEWAKQQKVRVRELKAEVERLEGIIERVHDEYQQYGIITAGTFDALATLKEQDDV